MRHAKLVLLATLAVTCSFLFQNCSRVGFDSTKGGVAAEATTSGSTTGASSAGSSDGQSIPSNGVTTGDPGVDGQTNPVITTIGSVDPDFNGANVYYVKFDILVTLLTDLVQIVYSPNPQSCQLSWDWTLLVLSFTGSHKLNMNTCGGFEAAAQVAAAQPSGSCTARVANTKTFGFAPVIDFVRTTEISSDCLCFRRYALAIIDGAVVQDEVRTFLPAATCAADFSEYQ